MRAGSACQCRRESTSQVLPRNCKFCQWCCAVVARVVLHSLPSQGAPHHRCNSVAHSGRPRPPGAMAWVWVVPPFLWDDDDDEEEGGLPPFGACLQVCPRVCPPHSKLLQLPRPLQFHYHEQFWCAEVFAAARAEWEYPKNPEPEYGSSEEKIGWVGRHGDPNPTPPPGFVCCDGQPHSTQNPLPSPQGLKG